MSRVTDKTRVREKRGTGVGMCYKPWLLAREIGSIGTESVFNDWKHHRPIQCLSQGEAKAYRLLRWRDDVIDIREQFPLDLKVTLPLARKMNLPHPHSTTAVMTTDFLVTFKKPNGILFNKAFNVKKNRTAFNDYALKNYAIEQAYWKSKGIQLEIIFTDDLNTIVADNIKRCVRYYNMSSVQTKTDFIKFLIARKFIKVDLTRPLKFPMLANQYLSTAEDVQKYLILTKEKLANNSPLLLA